MDEIAKNLGLAPLKDVVDAEIVETTSKPKPPTSVVASNSDSARDYKYARDNFIDIINTGQSALQDLLDVAQQSQHPRAYEVLSSTMKTLIDANKELVELSRSKEDRDTPKNAPSDSGKVTNNNLFVGSTAELQQMLKDMNNDASE